MNWMKQNNGELVESFKNNGVMVGTGMFGEFMKIDVELDGPVTIVME